MLAAEGVGMVVRVRVALNTWFEWMIWTEL
jgi:hypothetical protein